jgi:hypothetical protein
LHMDRRSNRLLQQVGGVALLLSFLISVITLIMFQTAVRVDGDFSDNAVYMRSPAGLAALSGPCPT